MADISFLDEIISAPADGSFVEISFIESADPEDVEIQPAALTSTQAKPVNKPKTKPTHGPYECEVCFKVFKYKYNLSRHIKLHTSQHACRSCSIALLMRAV